MNAPETHKVNIEVPANLEAVYSNMAVIMHSPSEVILDFAQVLPNVPRARVHARIITSPLHAKLLLRALQENLERYEAQFGEIRIPPSGEDLARQFFGEAKPES
jgi:hypothetical protein